MCIEEKVFASAALDDEVNLHLRNAGAEQCR
jgi:hypothetical protein